MSTSEKTLTLDKFPGGELTYQKQQQSKKFNVFSRFRSLLKRNSGVTQSTVEMEEKVTRELDRLSAYLPREMLEEAKSREEGLFTEEVLIQKALFIEVAVESAFVRNFKLLFTCYVNPVSFYVLPYTFSFYLKLTKFYLSNPKSSSIFFSPFWLLFLSLLVILLHVLLWLQWSLSQLY